MSFLDWFSGLTGQMSADMAIDLGTANTLVAITGEGIVINEPSVVAIEKSTQRVLAVGHEAKNMINHTPDAFSAEHPLKDGVIADYDVTEAMISAFINKAAERKYPWQPKPRIVVCIPCGATSVEKRAVFEATIQAGARQAYLIEEPMAAAMGADLPVTEPTGSMVVDIGGGSTEVVAGRFGEDPGRLDTDEKLPVFIDDGDGRWRHGHSSRSVGLETTVSCPEFASIGLN